MPRPPRSPSAETLGRYTLLRPLAQGGMGDVYLARVTGAAGFSRPAVIKRVKPELRDRDDAVGMFLDEARLSAQLSHPHIVQVYDLGETADGFYMAMEHVDGVHLGKLVRAALAKERPLAPTVCVYIAARVAEALHYAHHARDLGTGAPLQVVHRDVTPSNILLSVDGDVKLTDFGVAKAKTQQVKTARGYVKGKVAYLSPEQVELLPVDGRSDVFSLGVVLWEMLARMRLYKEADEFDAMHRIVHEPAPRPSRYHGELPLELDAIVLRALEKDPGQRYQTAGALQSALDGWLIAQGAFQERQRVARALSSLQDVLGLDDEPEQTGSTELLPGRRRSAPEPAASALPVFATPFVGRAAELAAMTRHFAEGGRYLALVGPEGIGKTRLAVELARRLLGPSGQDPGVVVEEACFCDLSGAGDLDAVAERAARGLGLPLAVGINAADAVVQIGSALADKGRALFVFDGVEPHNPTVAEALATFHRAADEALLLVTSRAPLDSDEASLFALKPLRSVDDSRRTAGPGSGKEPAEGGFDAIDLFVQRVRTLRPDYVLTDEDAATVSRLVARLGGNPLAIEVAAGQVSGADVVSLLGELPTTTPDDAAPEDAAPDFDEPSVSRAVDRSLEALEAAELDVLRQTAVFPGLISEEAAAAVIEPFGSEPLEAALSRLVQRSLLRREHHAARGLRLAGWRLVDGLRSRARARLRTWPGRPALEARFDRFYLERGEQLAAQVHGPLGPKARAALSAELENLVAVADRSLCHQAGQRDADAAVRIALVLDVHYAAAGPTTQHLDFLDRAAEQLLAFGASDPALPPRLWAARGQARLFRGWLDEAIEDLEEACSLAAEVADPALEARALLRLAEALRARGPAAAALPVLERALTLAQAAKDLGLEGEVQASLGGSALALGDLEGATAALSVAQEQLRDAGDVQGEGWATAHLARARLEQGDLAATGALCERGLSLLRSAPDRRGEAFVLTLAGELAERRGEGTEARRLWEEAWGLARVLGDPRLQARLQGLLARLGPALAGR